MNRAKWSYVLYTAGTLWIAVAPLMPDSGAYSPRWTFLVAGTIFFVIGSAFHADAPLTSAHPTPPPLPVTVSIVPTEPPEGIMSGHPAMVPKR